jgi:flavin-dependent dehydrogenase
VRRDRFDEMMLDNARRHGVRVEQGVAVREVLFDGSRAVGVRAVADGAERRVGAKVVVDASGTTGLLSRQLGLREPDPILKNAAIYAYYENELRDGDRNAGATIIIHTADRAGWFWSIPLPSGVSSIGLVAPPSHLFAGRGDDPLATLEDEIAACDGIRRRLQRARRVGGAYVTTDFSYGSREVAGDGWVLIGDAFGFLDPVYSSGVFLALKSGEFAADAIHEALVTGEPSGARLGAFGPRLRSGMRLIRQLVLAFYDPSFSFGRFSGAHPEYRDHIVRLLIGDVFNDEVGAVFDVMRDWVPALGAMRRDGSPTT